jgi:hypothetical protein
VLVVEIEEVFASFLVPADVGLPEVCECLLMLELCAPAARIVLVVVLVLLVFSSPFCHDGMRRLMVRVVLVVMEEQQWHRPEWPLSMLAWPWRHCFRLCVFEKEQSVERTPRSGVSPAILSRSLGDPKPED